MKRFLALAIATFAFMAPAEGKTVKVHGKSYGTGLISGAPVEGAEYHEGFRAIARPASFDSRDKNWIPPMRNQGQCGSCWDFAMTGATETAAIIAGKGKVDLAEQDALVNNKDASGCDGGYMNADWWVKKGQTTEALCPYKADDSVACKGAKWGKAANWKLIGGKSRAPSLEELQDNILIHGALPVTVAACEQFAPDKDGRITTCGCKQVNHMVQLVGYRKRADGGTEFLLKNQWGKGWGKDGYAWIQQGCDKLASTRGSAMFIEM
jgi:C1A family cysteine protease